MRHTATDAGPPSDEAGRLVAADLFAALPPEWPDDPLPAIQRAIRARGETVVVLDDDPTGTQTVHDVPVLTRWSADILAAELAAGPPALYILTNSRGVPPEAAIALNRDIGALLAAAGRATGRRYAVVSRGDSTLRGHYPAETDALVEGLGAPVDATLLIPAFIAGGRYTVGNRHYVADGDWLVPAAHTPFARDATFGYRGADMAAWVEEKSQGRIPASTVGALSIETIRAGGPDRVAGALLALAPGAVCVVNAASERDLAVVALGAIRAEEQGRRFLYRTAASFVRARGGLTARPLLTPAELSLPPTGGGLIIVGSYVPLTSTQVAALLTEGRVTAVEIAVERLLSPAARDDEIARAACAADTALRRGDDTVVVTSRDLVTGADAGGSLLIGQQISASLVAVMRAITTRPRYIIAKGGVTSSDVATAGLDVTRAIVRGQVATGVPAWQMGPESRYPGLAYIVFPGNVGQSRTLVDIVTALRSQG